MATKKKDTSKKMTDTVDIPRGITARKTSTGLTTFKVSIGTGPRRRVATFDRLDEAVAFRAMWTDVESERRRLGLQSLTKQEFLGQVAAPRLVIGTAGPQVEPLPIMKMIDELSAIMADSRKDPGSLDRDVKIFKRFIADTMAPSPVWTTESWKDATWTITSGSCSLDLCEHLDDSDRARVVAHYKSEAAAADERVKTVVALSDQVTVKIAGQFPRWLSRQNYATATAESILDFADRLWTKAVAHGHVHVNVFVQLKMSARDLARYNRKGHDRNAQTADAHTATQILTIAQLLRPTYLLAFWICVILGTRKSEPFGLRIGDWQPETGDLYLEHQRQGSPKRGRSSLKRPESKRPVPVPHQIATALNEYIRNTHGVDPENKVALEGVKDRYLIVGAKGGPMDPNSFARAVKDAALAGGIDPQTVGTFKPVHHLRKTLGALLQSNRSLSGRAISILLGHKVHDTVEINTTARVTDKHYNPTIASELRAVVAAIEDWIDGEVLASMGNTDLLHFGEIVDPMSVDDAAARLSEGGSDRKSVV